MMGNTDSKSRGRCRSALPGVGKKKETVKKHKNQSLSLLEEKTPATAHSFCLLQARRPCPENFKYQRIFVNTTLFKKPKIVASKPEAKRASHMLQTNVPSEKCPTYKEK